MYRLFYAGGRLSAPLRVVCFMVLSSPPLCGFIADAAVQLLSLFQSVLSILAAAQPTAHRLKQSQPPQVIVWLRRGNTSRRALHKWYELLVPQIAHLIDERATLSRASSMK